MRLRFLLDLLYCQTFFDRSRDGPTHLLVSLLHDAGEPRLSSFVHLNSLRYMVLPHRLPSSTLVCNNDGRLHPERKGPVMREQQDDRPNRLCASCQLSCKQSGSAEVLLCPRYVAVPKQSTLLGNLVHFSADNGTRCASARLI